VSPSTRLLAAASAALLAASSAMADDLPDIHIKDLKAAADAAPASQAVVPPNPSCDTRFPGLAPYAPAGATPKKFCSDVASCERFCCSAFGFDATKWTGVYDWKTTNVLAPLDIPGTIQPDSADLVDLGRELRDMRVLTNYSGKTATKAVADGLRRLDAILDGVRGNEPKTFTVDVSNCYRRAIGNEIKPLSSIGPDANAEAVCGELFVMMRLEDKPARGAGEQKLLDDLHSTQDGAFQMSWPGWTPHAAGDACDLIVRDEKSQPCFGSTAGTPDSPTCAIEQRHAVDLISDAVTSAGGARLDYEAWHFEWGGATGSGSCRCTGDGCKSIWPVTLKSKKPCPD